MKEIKFSFFYSEFSGIKDTKPKKEIDIPELFKIYNSEKLIELSKGVREARGESQKQLKNMLPAITPYGTFSKRGNDFLCHYNQNLIALDFDNLELNEIEEIKAICRNSENVLLCALSPRNAGLKILAFINHEFTPENHATCIKQNLSKILSILGLNKFTPDESQSTLSQAFFLCHDPGMYFNAKATATNIPLQAIKPTRKQITINHATFNKDRVSNILNGLLNRNIEEMINAPNGNRHQTILKNIKAFGLIKTYDQTLMEIYFQRLKSAIEMAYLNESKEEIEQALKTLSAIRENSRPETSDLIEEAIRENNRIEIASSYFINAKEYKHEKDSIEVYYNRIAWYFEGYLLARYNPSTPDEIYICFSGFPTAKKIDRLNSINGVKIIETKDHVLLNGEIWCGSQKTIISKISSHVI